MDAIIKQVEAYVLGTRTGDVNLLKTVFHKSAVMSGDLFNHKMICDSPEHFFNDIEGETVDESYRYNIQVLRHVQDIAVVELKEMNLKGANFLNIFQMQKIDGEWYITSKLFTSTEAL